MKSKLKETEEELLALRKKSKITRTNHRSERQVDSQTAKTSSERKFVDFPVSILFPRETQTGLSSFKSPEKQNQCEV